MQSAYGSFMATGQAFPKSDLKLVSPLQYSID